MAAHSEPKVSKRELKFPKEWATLEDIFLWITERGFKKPTKYETRRLWLCAYPSDDIDRSRLVDASKSSLGLDSIVYAIRGEETLVLYSFKSPRGIKHLSENEIFAGYTHANFVSAGRKKDFISVVLRGGCVIVGEREKARIARTGGADKGKRVSLCTDIQTINPLDHYFVPGEEVEEAEVIVASSTEEDEASGSESEE